MRAALLALAFIGAGGMALADPVEGVWQTRPDDNGDYGHVEIAACGAAFCGVLVRAFDGAGAEKTASPNIGKQIVWDMTAEGDGAYGGGKVWAPDRDKTYRAKMALAGDSLSVSGCVLGGIICRASEWKRVK